MVAKMRRYLIAIAICLALTPLVTAAVGDRPVLTVAEMPDFARAGGIINLKTTEEDRLRVEIDTGTARRAGLKLSSKLLSLAEITK